MDEEIIFLDTSVLIDYFRKTKKENSFLYQLSKNYRRFAVSIITKFEILIGSNAGQQEFWDKFFEEVEVVNYTEEANYIAIDIYKKLKVTNQIIGFADLLIGATALANNRKIATLNESHLGRIGRHRGGSRISIQSADR